MLGLRFEGTASEVKVDVVVDGFGPGASFVGITDAEKLSCGLKYVWIKLYICVCMCLFVWYECWCGPIFRTTTLVLYDPHFNDIQRTLSFKIVTGRKLSNDWALEARGWDGGTSLRAEGRCDPYQQMSSFLVPVLFLRNLGDDSHRG